MSRRQSLDRPGENSKKLPLPIVISISFHLLSISGLHTCTLRAYSRCRSHSFSLFVTIAVSLCLLERALVALLSLLLLLLKINCSRCSENAAQRSCSELSVLLYFVVGVANNRGSNNCENKQQQQNAKTVVIQSQMY